MTNDSERAASESEASIKNGTPIPTRLRYRFEVVQSGYVCGGCGAIVSSKVADVRRHDDWHLAGVVS